MSDKAGGPRYGSHVCAHKKRALIKRGAGRDVTLTDKNFILNSMFELFCQITLDDLDVFLLKENLLECFYKKNLNPRSYFKKYSKK